MLSAVTPSLGNIGTSISFTNSLDAFQTSGFLIFCFSFFVFVFVFVFPGSWGQQDYPQDLQEENLSFLQHFETSGHQYHPRYSGGLFLQCRCQVLCCLMWSANPSLFLLFQQKHCLVRSLHTVCCHSIGAFVCVSMCVSLSLSLLLIVMWYFCPLLL